MCRVPYTFRPGGALTSEEEGSEQETEGRFSCNQDIRGDGERASGRSCEWRERESVLVLLEEIMETSRSERWYYSVPVPVRYYRNNGVGNNTVYVTSHGYLPRGIRNQ